MAPITIYTASKTRHADKWRRLRAEDPRFRVNATWIDEAGAGQTKCFTDLWRRCVAEASAADALLLYVEEGEQLKGALVEVGAALATGTPVYVVGPDDVREMTGSWVYHGLVRGFLTVDLALNQIAEDYS